MKPRHLIYGVHVSDRVKKAPDVQKVLTEFGCFIKTRIGLHEATGRAVSPNGVILLEMVGAKQRCSSIVDALNAIAGVACKILVFEHD